MTDGLVVATPSPVDLAVVANNEHALARQSGESMLEHAFRAGEALIGAKAQLRHGEWLPWLAANFDGSEDMAERYMQLASNSARVRNLEEPSLRKALAAIANDNGLAPLMSSDTPEWYTPKHVIEAVVAAMGGIDLDPCAEPAKSVPALNHFTEVDDGLSRPWHGRVYMNPPYGKTIGAWVDKLGEEFEYQNITEAIALVPARTDTSWWAHLPANMVCFITGRLSFSGHENSAPFPSAACYLGPNDRKFADAFLGLGLVYVRLEVGG